MNWKTLALRALRWKVLALGAVAGLWGAVLHESVRIWQPVPGALPMPAVLAGAALGLGLGLLLAPVDALLRHCFRRALRSAALGAVLGAAMGAAGAYAQDALGHWGPLLAPMAWATPPVLRWAALILTLGLIGGGIGLAAGLVALRRGRIVRRALLGLVLGGILGVPVVAAAHVPFQTAWVVLGALVAWGALLALGLHWWEKRGARRWLRLLSGPGEDDIFPLAGGQITLGKNERNDIPLLAFQEIYPYHCELRWSADHYDIVDNDRGGVVLVNYRQVQEHALKPGDLIKIGSALLQYGEAS